jgi:hypothetical protein
VKEEEQAKVSERTQQWLPFHASPTNPSLQIQKLCLQKFLPQIWVLGFWVSEEQEELGGSDSSPLKLDPPMAPKPHAGSNSVRMVLMLKVLGFMVASHVMILIEMMLNRLVITTINYSVKLLFPFMFTCVVLMNLV